MRKGIKILGKVLSAVILLLILLPLTLSLLLDIPAVQNFVVQKAVRMVSNRLETTVAIRRVDISAFSKIRLQGFYVEDYQRDTLLYVDRLEAFVTGFGLFGGGINMSRAELQGAKLYLRETPDGEMNIKQVVARLSDPDKPRKGNFRLSIRNASLTGMDFCLERRERRDPPYGIDFWHMHLYDLAAYVDDFTIDGQAIYTTIESLSARERSGFALDRFSGRFYLTSGCMGFQDVHIVTRRSSVSIPYISMVGDSWAEYKDFIGQVRIDGALRNTDISTDDVAYFAPALRDWHLDFSNLDVEVAGVVSDFTAKLRSLRIGEDTWLTADASVRGLPVVKKTWFDLTVPHVTTTAQEVDLFAERIGRKKLSEDLMRMLARTGDIDLSARFVGQLSSFDMQLGAATDLGKVSCNVAMKPLRNGRQSVRGDVSTQALKLGELLDRSDLLGSASLSAWVDGVVGSGYTDANIVGNVTSLSFNGYVYDSLRMDGRLRNREFDGHITARDPNLDFDFLGMVDFNDSIPLYDFTLDLRHADLTALHINRRDSVSQLSARLAAKAGGRSLDDLNGHIQITDATYRYNDRQIEAQNLTVTGENSADSKLIELRSDFADATFRSKTSYRVVFDYLRRSAWKYLPILRSEKQQIEAGSATTAVADDYSLLSVSIRRDFNSVADAFSAGLQVADDSSLQMLFNPASDKLSFKATSEYIERKRMLATRLTVNASNRGDSLAVYASAEDLYAWNLHLPNLSLTGGAKQGDMQLSVGFDDTLRKLSGLVGVRAEVTDDQSPEGRTVDLRILPSHITRGDKTWQIYAHNILIDTTQVKIDRFLVLNREQELLLNGVASRSLDDSLTLRLRNFDLAPFTQIADRLGYSIEGRTNGEATMKSALRGGEISADILFDSLTVNGIPGPPLRLASRWDFARNRAGVTVTDRIKRDTLIRGFYDPGQVRYYARLKMDSLALGLLDPVLDGVISSTEGLASADMVLQGQHRNADLTGTVRIADFRTKVDFTQVTYTIPQAVLDVKNNRFQAVNVPVFDEYDNRANLDLTLDLQHLSNIAYDLHVTPDQLLVLNTTEKDNDYFYGQVYATGTARISGDKGSVKLDIAAVTDDNSSFFMPMSNKSNLSYADFVVFEKPVQVDTVDNLSRRKMLFERKRRETIRTGNRMNISLALNVRPNVEVELLVAGNPVKARGEGMLNLQIDPRSNVFEMYGDYTITDGSYNFSLENLINKRFVIESGSTIQWTGSPMDALLDIDAIYKLKASLQPLLQNTVTSTDGSGLGNDRSVPVECIIHLGDRLTNPAVTFDVRIPGSDPETQAVIANTLNTPEETELQFLYLMLFNSFYSESTSGANSNLGASVPAGMGFGFLSNMVSNLLSVDDYNIVIRYRPKSELTSDEVDFGLSKSLINNRLFVEVEGNYLIDNKQAVSGSMSNFMGEAYITYLIDRAGALKLKAFTQTIDRFDENQGLQETGIGIYFKEDFNNFRDLRRRIKERFTNKKRKERRLARRAARKAVQMPSPMTVEPPQDSTRIQTYDPGSAEVSTTDAETRTERMKLK